MTASREACENLPFERDLVLAESRHELVLRHALPPRGLVDAHDPEPPERALLVLAVPVGVRERVVELLLGAPVARVLETPVAARLLEHLAALLACVNGSLHPRHRSATSQQLFDGLLIAWRDRL